jgi:hypothetical protein
MEALMLIAESATLLPKFKQILADTFPSAFIIAMSNPGEFIIEFSNNSRVYVEDYGSSLEDIGWEADEIARIKEIFPGHHQVYNLAYRGIDAAKKVIIHLANSNQMMVDNDCGTLLLGADFVHKVIDEPNWYWFDDLQQDDQ